MTATGCIDYEKVLRMYIKHVIECAGTDFLSHSHNTEGLTKEENAALRNVGDFEYGEYLLQ